MMRKQHRLMSANCGFRALGVCSAVCVFILFTTDGALNVQADDSRFAIVIHGGAGGLSKAADQQKQSLNRILSTGRDMLKSGAGSLDTVEAVVRLLEDDPLFNAGRGAVLNAAGTHELDASIMDGRNRAAGAVGAVTIVRNPISLARCVMTRTDHVLLVADGADAFAKSVADDPQIAIVANDYFTTEHRRRQWEKLQKNKAAAPPSMSTVGCVAIDLQGNLAAATSTGGLMNKKFGRLGDSPLIGAGTFADNASCAVSCTGIGEDFIRNAVAYDIAARVMYRGQSLDKAVQEILDDQQRPVRGGVIAIDRSGQIVMKFNSRAMARGAADSTGRFEVGISP